MEQVLVAVTGPDRSGVVYTVAEALHKLKCSFVDMDQTTVRNQFSSIMIVEKQEVSFLLGRSLINMEISA